METIRAFSQSFTSSNLNSYPEKIHDGRAHIERLNMPSVKIVQSQVFHMDYLINTKLVLSRG